MMYLTPQKRKEKDDVSLFRGAFFFFFAAYLYFSSEWCIFAAPLANALKQKRMWRESNAIVTFHGSLILPSCWQILVVGRPVPSIVGALPRRRWSPHPAPRRPPSWPPCPRRRRSPHPAPWHHPSRPPIHDHCAASPSPSSPSSSLPSDLPPGLPLSDRHISWGSQILGHEFYIIC